MNLTVVGKRVTDEDQRHQAHHALCALIGATPFDRENPNANPAESTAAFVFFKRFGIRPWEVPGAPDDGWAAVRYAEAHLPGVAARKGGER